MSEATLERLRGVFEQEGLLYRFCIIKIIQYENYGIGLRLCNSWSRN